MLAPSTPQSCLPAQRWCIASPPPDLVAAIAAATGLSPLLARVLIERGADTPERAALHVNPEAMALPDPLEAFPDLAKSVDLLQRAIADGTAIAICGDYDADGMTSTALLLRALGHAGAQVDYAIPSRMQEGYGINCRIVEEFAAAGVGLILTVDNGIAAYDAIARAVELGLEAIVTDHHDLPAKLPPAGAILNPKLLPEESPYRGLAGVGVAYVLAVTLARSQGQLAGLTGPLLELFTLGTIADLAPLTGVNRRWLRRGLRLLPQSRLAGVQSLMQIAGVKDDRNAVKPEDIGFRLGPRINAIGRLSDPQIAIELLATDDPSTALARAMQCEAVNRQRQQLCRDIEREAIGLLDEDRADWQQHRAIVLVQPHWHHGVIGIVASRLVERYGVPVFLGTHEDDAGEHLRGSARSIPEFHVFEALEFCSDLLEKFGGHKAAGGFSLVAKNLDAFRDRLSRFAHRCLQPEHLKPLVAIDTRADFPDLTSALYQEIDSLQPWGIGNEQPVFWTPNVCVLAQRRVGENHLKATFVQPTHPQIELQAIAWRWGEYLPLPPRIDIAYKLRENSWQGRTSIELELVGVRAVNQAVEPSGAAVLATNPTAGPNPIAQITGPSEPSVESPTPLSSELQQTEFQHQGRAYACRFWSVRDELRIRNGRGQTLCVRRGRRIGMLHPGSGAATEIDVTRSPYCHIVKAAIAALESP
ncbi:single-stranded-DNA-specific exonuclease RecJ [Rubidibacter lacunae KORDI 51-2]|uniref:Single-stranded-DNA-specific exonuclease RecJ n=1 Tax=Rubidibacter lacunae KORDI 51-2 TaxID=582515 RepID=U5DEN7_9CHRO|nr:single-stranded-DNA-specific exonuclease RecJ [Rubidibacter lacunae]ERN42963.1 single-stranded-DNA-specific exonuclease RecJ [Rubidibacter lacunae KORDI 51-2]